MNRGAGLNGLQGRLVVAKLSADLPELYRIVTAPYTITALIVNGGTDSELNRPERTAGQERISILVLRDLAARLMRPMTIVPFRPGILLPRLEGPWCTLSPVTISA